MKLGLFADCLGKRSFEEMLELSAAMKIECLEMSTGTWSKPKHMNRELLLESADARSEFLGAIASHGLELAALNCSGNQLEPTETGKQHAEVVEKTFRLAGLLGIKKVVMMSGLPGGGPGAKYPVWVTNTWPRIFTDMLEYQWNEVAIPWWREAVKRAADCGVEKIALENHPNTLVFNVSTMRRLRDAVGEMVGMNLDPSHTFYMGGDPIVMAKQLAADGIIYHVHGKDTRIEPDMAAAEALFEICPHDTAPNARPWSYVAVGEGHDQLWWRRFLAALKMNGYDDVISLEVGDMLMGDVEGIDKSAKFLYDIL